MGVLGLQGGSNEVFGFQPQQQGVELALLQAPDEPEAFRVRQMLVDLVTVHRPPAKEAEQGEFHGERVAFGAAHASSSIAQSLSRYSIWSEAESVKQGRRSALMSGQV